MYPGSIESDVANQADMAMIVMKKTKSHRDS